MTSQEREHLAAPDSGLWSARGPRLVGCSLQSGFTAFGFTVLLHCVELFLCVSRLYGSVFVAFITWFLAFKLKYLNKLCNFYFQWSKQFVTQLLLAKLFWLNIDIFLPTSWLLYCFILRLLLRKWLWILYSTCNINKNTFVMYVQSMFYISINLPPMPGYFTIIILL